MICLLANGLEAWRSKKANGGVADKDAKMRFSAGENIKRERGTLTWNKEGREYFKSTETAWKRAFKTGTEDYKILGQYWNKWIEKEGKTFMLSGTKVGVKKKCTQRFAHGACGLREVYGYGEEEGRPQTAFFGLWPSSFFLVI